MHQIMHQTYFIEGDEVGYISEEDNQHYGFFLPVFCSDSEEELIEMCEELNKDSNNTQSVL